MDVRITVRRGRSERGFRAIAEEKARRLRRYEPRLIRVELLFDQEGARELAEARCAVPRVPTLVARAASDSRRTSLDRVIQKAARQLRKERSRRTDHQAPPVAALGG